MKYSLKRVRVHHWVTVLAFVLVASAIGYIAYEGYDRITNLTEQVNVLAAQSSALSDQNDVLSAYIESLESGFTSTTSALEENIAETQSSFTEALEEEKQNVTAIEEQLGSFEDEVGEISGTVTTLEKLSKTDPELMQKYSKVFFLNEHYEPPRLVEISNQYKYNESKDLLIHDKVWPYLENMLLATKQDNVEIYVSSAFRPFSEQEALKGQYTVIYGEGTANQFSADQGYSEHQLGTTADLITTGIGGTLPGFENTKEYTWLLANAHKYGFVLSYPQDNAYYIFEPWHWRFVGVSLAADLYNAGQHFHDLDQREIDEYLVSIFD